MSKHDHAFIEKTHRFYIPEDSPLFEEIKESIFYQQGLRDGLKARQQMKRFEEEESMTQNKSASEGATKGQKNITSHHTQRINSRQKRAQRESEVEL